MRHTEFYVKDILKSLEPFVGKVRQFVTENNTTPFGILAVTCIIILLATVKSSHGPSFQNKVAGFRIAGPVGWRMTLSSDKNTVSFEKRKKYKDAKSVIKLVVTYGNPYGKTPLDYIENNLLKQVLNTYGQSGETMLSFQDTPAMEYRDKQYEPRASARGSNAVLARGSGHGQVAPDRASLDDNRPWAKFSFFVDFKEFYLYYVTQASDERVFIVSLISKGDYPAEDERTFYKTLDSLVIKDISRVSVFSE